MKITTLLFQTATTAVTFGLPFLTYIAILRLIRKELASFLAGTLGFLLTVGAGLYLPRLLWQLDVLQVALALPAGLKILILFGVGAFYGALAGARASFLKTVSNWSVWLPWFVLLAAIVVRTQLVVPVLGVLWWLWIAHRLGVWALAGRGFRLPAFVAVGTGLALLMILAITLGHLRLLVAPAVYLLGLAVSVVWWRHLILFLRSCAGTLRKKFARGAAHGALTGVGATLLVLGIFQASMPEAGSDALGGRVALTKRFLEQGSLEPFQDIAYSFGVVGGEALQSFFYPFAEVHVARLLAVGLCGVLFFSFQNWKPFARLWLVPLVVSSLTLWQFTSGHVDLLQALFWAAAFFTAFRFLRTGENWFVPGLLAGSAAAVKLNGLVTALGCAVMLLGTTQFRRRFYQAITFSAGFLLALGPWLLRSYHLTGNPLFPFAQQFFPGSIQQNLAFGGASTGLKWKEILHLPYLLIVQPERFVEAGAFHPLVILGLVFTFWSLFAKSIRPLAAGASVSWLFWAFSVRNLRYALGPAWLSTLTVFYLALLWTKKRIGTRLTPLALGSILVAAGALWDFSRATGWFLRTPTGFAFPVERFLKAGQVRGYVDEPIPSAILGRFIRDSRQPWPQVCEAGLRDHLYIPGTQPNLWHSLEPLASGSYRLFFGNSIGSALQASTQLGCDWILLHLGPHSKTPLERRNGVFSLEFWKRFGRLRGALGAYVLLEKKGSNRDQESWLPHPILSFEQPKLLGDLGGPERDKATLSQVQRITSQVLPVRSANLISCTWRANGPSEGFVDLVVRDETGDLLVFSRQDFVMAVGETFLFFHSLPQQSDKAQLSFHGQLALEKAQCDLYQVADR